MSRSTSRMWARRGLETFLLGDDASDHCGGIGAEQPEPPVALSLCRGGRRDAGSR